MRADWIEHRRGLDGELLGWMEPEGEGFVVVDLLGRRRTAVVDWHIAEETLDALGIGYLADIYEMRTEVGDWLRVRISEVSASRIRVKDDDWGAIGASQIFYTLPFPVPEGLLRARRSPRQ